MGNADQPPPPTPQRPSPPAGSEDAAERARADLASTAEALRKARPPREVEPAFVFRA